MADERIKVSQLPLVEDINNFEVLGVDASNNSSAKANMTQLRGNTGAQGFAPVIKNGAIQTGEPESAATITLTPNGTTPEGAPLYTLTGSIPRGIDGLAPVLQNGNIQTGAPGSNVTLTLTPNGTAPGGNPIYRIDGSIPRGEPGEGSGNVTIDATGLIQGNRYVFVPTGNDTAVGVMQSAEAIHVSRSISANQWVLQGSLWTATINDSNIIDGCTVTYSPSIATTTIYVEAGVYSSATVTVGSMVLSANSQPEGTIEILYTIQP